jgi:hypothetical protein
LCCQDKYIGIYHETIAAITQKLNPQAVRHELHLMSLLISNLKTHSGELLQENAKGYDQFLQTESQRRLFEIVEQLHKWEEGK